MGSLFEAIEAEVPGAGGKADVRADPEAVAVARESERIRQLEKENAELRRANDVLKAAVLFSPRNSPPAVTLIRFIDAHRDRFGAEPVCRTLAWVDSFSRRILGWKRANPGRG